MTKDEALRMLDAGLYGEYHAPTQVARALAREALRREVEQEPPERPSLLTQEQQCRWLGEQKVRHLVGASHPFLTTYFAAAADTLQVVREQVVPWLRLMVCRADTPPAADLLRALGETP